MRFQSMDVVKKARALLVTGSKWSLMNGRLEVRSSRMNGTYHLVERCRR